jgi:hypothetical protein
MPIAPRRTRRGARLLLPALAAAGVLLLVGLLVFSAQRDPEVPFLPARAGAEWILYPAPATTVGYVALPLDSWFVRSVSLPRQPARATLEVRWFEHGAVRVNGVTVAELAPGGNWKDATRIDVTTHLRPGENTVELRVVNDGAPGAAWLALRTEDGVVLATDGTWTAVRAGGAERSARLARVPMSEWGGVWLEVPASFPRPFPAVRQNLPLLLLFALVGWLVVVLVRGRLDASAPPPRRVWWGLFAAAAVATAALHWRIALRAEHWGFDLGGHLQYLRMVLEQGHLPLANEGWATYHPPLYYLALAGFLRLTGHATVTGAEVAIHVFGWLVGLLQIGGVLVGLRALFADRFAPVATGVFVAVCLPMRIYISNYVSNEAMLAALLSVATAYALRGYARADRSARFVLTLGALLGLALLTKVTALVVVVVLLAVEGGRLLADRERSAGRWLLRLGGLAGPVVLLAGWHYLRVFRHFGRAFGATWSGELGFDWAMDPGYATAEWVFAAGRSLVTPWFAATHSWPDGVYSTLWGDALGGGTAHAGLLPPWNLGLAAAGFALALLPSGLLLAGTAAALRRWLARQQAGWATVLAVAGALGAALLAINLKLPFYGVAKAFYVLGALLPLAALIALAVEKIARTRLLVILSCGGLAAWGLASCASFWVTDREPAGRASATLERLLDPGGRLATAAAAATRGDRAAVVTALRATVGEMPDHPIAWQALGDELAALADDQGAITAWREAVRIDPRQAGLHERLAAAYRRLGLGGPAEYHRSLAARVRATEAGGHRASRAGAGATAP